MSQRAGLRFFRTFQTFRSNFGQTQQRRWQSTAEAGSNPVGGQTLLQKFYNSPVGPKTVHFWAPVMKWAVVLVGVSDFARPAESLSLTQNVALMATGAIWTRWCMIIKPKNVLLAAVNFFLFCVGSTQVGRILTYQQSVKNGSIKKDTEGLVEGVVDDSKKAMKDIVGAK